MDKHMGFGGASSPDRTVTMPEEVWKALGLNRSDAVIEYVERDGEIVLVPRIAAHPNDVWFWEEGQQQAEREADEEFAAGRFHPPMTGEQFLAHMENVTGEKVRDD